MLQATHMILRILCFLADQSHKVIQCVVLLDLIFDPLLGCQNHMTYAWEQR